MDVDLTIRYSDYRLSEIIASRSDVAAPLYRIVSRPCRPRLEPDRDNAGSTPPLRNHTVAGSSPAKLCLIQSQRRRLEEKLGKRP